MNTFGKPQDEKETLPAGSKYCDEYARLRRAALLAIEPTTATTIQELEFYEETKIEANFALSGHVASCKQCLQDDQKHQPIRDQTGQEIIAIFGTNANSLGDVASPKCTRCASELTFRQARSGFFQKVVASKLGFYPWYCHHCRSIFFARRRGKSPRSTDGRSSSQGLRA